MHKLENQDYIFDLVLKYSWQLLSQQSEVEAIKIAREADPVHTPEIFRYSTIKDSSPHERLRDRCLRKSKRHDVRELRLLVMREYLPVSKMGMGDEFWDVLVQLMGCESVTFSYEVQYIDVPFLYCRFASIE